MTIVRASAQDGAVFWTPLTPNSDKTRKMPMEQYEGAGGKAKENHRIHFYFFLSEHRQIFQMSEAAHIWGRESCTSLLSLCITMGVSLS